jgi:hypothetical protein
MVGGGVSEPTKLGKLAWPYPVTDCGNGSHLNMHFGEGDDAYLYRDLEEDKLVVFCDDCARHVELNHAERFKLVAL